MQGEWGTGSKARGCCSNTKHANTFCVLPLNTAITSRQLTHHRDHLPILSNAQQPCLQTYAPKSFPSLPKYTPSPKPASRLTG